MQSRACSARFPHFSGHCNLSVPDNAPPREVGVYLAGQGMQFGVLATQETAVFFSHFSISCCA